MMNYIIGSALLSIITANVSSTEVSKYEYGEKKNIIELLTNINEGYKIIYDYCENIQLNEGYIFKETKPDCYFNYSYIDSEDMIHLFKIDNSIRLMFKDYKNGVCKEQKIECGEFTIVLKLVDIINSAIHIIMLDSNNYNIWNNLQVIDFYSQIQFLKYAVNNIELLTNITLKRDKINMLLTVEKNKLSDKMNSIGVNKFLGYIYNYIGSPIEKTGSYISSILGTAVGETIDKIIPDLGSDTKIIIIIILIILLKRL